MTQFILLFLFIVGVLAILAIYIVKAGIQLQLIQAQAKKDEGRVIDILFFDFTDAEARKTRLKALLMYPLLFPIEMEENEKPNILEIKQRIKRVNIALYFVLMLLLLLVIYISKAYPNGLF